MGPEETGRGPGAGPLTAGDGARSHPRAVTGTACWGEVSALGALPPVCVILLFDFSRVLVLLLLLALLVLLVLVLVLLVLLLLHCPNGPRHRLHTSALLFGRVIARICNVGHHAKDKQHSEK
jgi:hypothetical protein